MVPFQILVVPLFIEIKYFGWENSYTGLILPGLINAFGVFMMRQYAEALPDELLEAARVDGASELYIFLRIVLPLLAPALVSLGIIVFIWAWGAFLWPLVVVQDRNLYVLSVGLSVICLSRRGPPSRVAFGELPPRMSPAATTSRCCATGQPPLPRCWS